MDIINFEQKIKSLTEENDKLIAFKNDYASAKQSLNRMSSRLRKLCKRLTPTNEIVIEMQNISKEIKNLVKDATTQD
jgi:phenylalanyl-tRNA synthetase alpha subunit